MATESQIPANEILTYMRSQLVHHTDFRTNEVNTTSLAEDAHNKFYPDQEEISDALSELSLRIAEEEENRLRQEYDEWGNPQDMEENE